VTTVLQGLHRRKVVLPLLWCLQFPHSAQVCSWSNQCWKVWEWK